MTAQGAQFDQNIPDNTNIALNNGGFLHVVLDVMTAPDGNISESIQNNANLSQLANAIQVADISDEVFTGKLSSKENEFITGFPFSLIQHSADLPFLPHIPLSRIPFIQALPHKHFILNRSHISDLLGLKSHLRHSTVI